MTILWTPTEYDKFSVGLYRKNKVGIVEQEQLLGHVPVELSSLLFHFLNADGNNTVTAIVTGKRKREVGLVVPCQYIAETDSGRLARILDEQLHAKKEKYKALELKHRKKGTYRKFPLYN